jgi:histidinol-phosphate/aromatic aminotransferase/cobyric acid decarboxylase-like protein
MVTTLEKHLEEDTQSTQDERPRMVKVTMNLTAQDEENANFVMQKTGARSKAQAVSTALSLTHFLIEKLVEEPSTNLTLKSRDGTELRIVMPELEAARKTK